jgi:hypothetical protein
LSLQPGSQTDDSREAPKPALNRRNRITPADREVSTTSSSSRHGTYSCIANAPEGHVAVITRGTFSEIDNARLTSLLISPHPSAEESELPGNLMVTPEDSSLDPVYFSAGIQTRSFTDVSGTTHFHSVLVSSGAHILERILNSDDLRFVVIADLLSRDGTTSQSVQIIYHTLPGFIQGYSAVRNALPQDTLELRWPQTVSFVEVVPNPNQAEQTNPDRIFYSAYSYISLSSETSVEGRTSIPASQTFRASSRARVSASRQDMQNTRDTDPIDTEEVRTRERDGRDGNDRIVQNARKRRKNLAPSNSSQSPVSSQQSMLRTVLSRTTIPSGRSAFSVPASSSSSQGRTILSRVAIPNNSAAARTWFSSPAAPGRSVGTMTSSSNSTGRASALLPTPTNAASSSSIQLGLTSADNDTSSTQEPSIGRHANSRKGVKQQLTFIGEILRKSVSPRK